MPKFLGYLCLIIAIVCSAMTTHAATKSDQEQFLADSYARFRLDPSDFARAQREGIANAPYSLDLEVLLYASLSRAQHSSEPLQGFSHLLNISLAQAQSLSENLYTLLKLRKECDRLIQQQACQVRPESLTLLRNAAQLPHADRFLLAAAKNLFASAYQPYVISEIERHSAARELLLSLYLYNQNDVYLSLLLQDQFRDPGTFAAILQAPPQHYGRWHQLALNEFIVKQLLALKHPMRFAAYNFYLTELLTAGIVEVPDSLIKTSENEIIQYERIIRASDKNPTLPLLLAAAKMLENNLDTANTLLEQYADMDHADQNTKLLSLFLSEYSHRRLAKEDLYYVYLEGVSKRESIERYTAQKQDRLLFFDSSTAWSNLVGFSPLSDQLLARYFRERGYRDIAPQLHSNHSVAQTHIGVEPSPFYRSLDTAAEDYRQRANHHASTLAREDSPALEPDTRSQEPRIREVALTEIEVEELPELDFPDQLPLPVERSQIVRRYYDGRDWYIVYLSDAVDPAGSVSKGGYWMQKTLGGGHFWGPSIYLGLQQYAPYEILNTSSRAMVQSNTIELKASRYKLPEISSADVELDTAQYRLPEDIYLQFSWDEISSDQDQDGLNDILERHIGSNPLLADSDLDGMPDGQDRLPLETFIQSAQQYNPVAMALLERLLSYQITPESDAQLAPMRSGFKLGAQTHEQQTLFVAASPKYFQGIQPPLRLIFVSPEQVRQRQQQGLFFPLSLELMLSNTDATDFYVQWNASWTGGSFRIRVIDGNVEVENLGNWIGSTN